MDKLMAKSNLDRTGEGFSIYMSNRSVLSHISGYLTRQTPSYRIGKS